MIQNILALMIVAAVVAKTIYSVYKAITTKEKSLCGGCASCDLKSELKKKGKLAFQNENKHGNPLRFSAENLKYISNE